MSDAESLLRDLIVKIAHEHDFGNYELNIKSINSGGANFTSVLFLVTVECPGKENVKIFAKVANMGENLRVTLDANKMYKLEVLFYTKLSKIYESLEFKRNVADKDRLLVPKFYGCNTNIYEETLLLQNLVAKGYKNHNRLKPMDWEYAASTIQNLAKFHALSFAYQKENPEEFKQMCKDLEFEIILDDAMKEMQAKQVKETVEILKEEYRPRVLKLLESFGDDVWMMLNRPLGTKVIIHGDYRSDNLMYKQEDNKVDAIILDYQTIHVGCPVTDFLYFYASATDSKFRVEHHDRLVNYYYAELSAAMQRLGVDPTEVYSREVFDSELKQMMPLFLMLSMFMLRLVLMDAELAPKIDGDGGFENFLSLPANSLFVERFSGAVEDCVRWGII